MDKKQLKIDLAVLNAVRSTFSETKNILIVPEECQRGKITADEVIFCF